MRDYELKRGQAKVIEGDGLRAMAAAAFGSASLEESKVIASLGALERIVVWTDGKRLFVETTMKTGVPDSVATDTIKAYNLFLEEATGYTAKERAKRAQKDAKAGVGRTER